ncbi:MAG: hypothetical protein KA714_13240 [Limnoraphis sp. WC205]|nr:hypothetical protein [Limnoraphis sp. WC205]
MKILSIPVWLTVILHAVCLLNYPVSKPFGQSSTYFADHKNHVPPEVKDGGSRFSQPAKNLDIDTDLMRI